MEERTPDPGTRVQDVTFVPAPLPIEGTKEEHSKYDDLIRQFFESGHPSARVQVSWEVAAPTPRQQVERAKGLAVNLRKVARRLGLPVQVVVRKAEVYLVREEARDEPT